MHDKLNEILDKYIDGSTVKKIHGSYFNEHGYKLRHSFQIFDQYQTVSIHLWKGCCNYKYAIRIRIGRFATSSDVYYIEWKFDEEEFFKMVDTFNLKTMCNVNKAMEIILNISIGKSLFKARYDLR